MDRISFELNIGLRVSEQFQSDADAIDFMAVVRAVFEMTNQCRTNLSRARALGAYLVEEGATTAHGETVAEPTAVMYATGFTPHDAQLFLAHCRELATSLHQSCIAVRIRKNGCRFGALLIGEYAHLWNFGVFDERYFMSYDAAHDTNSRHEYYEY